MDIQTFLSFAVVGGLMKVLIDSIKVKFAMEGNATKLLTIGVALVVGSLFFWVSNTQWVDSVVGVLVASSTVYAFLRK